MTGITAISRTRDAQRSREAIVDAAERLFAQHGYDGVSLGEIAAAAKLSRGTPSYFFGSKPSLYEAVLERSFARREAAVASACAPLRAWARQGGGERALRGALASMTQAYLAFLVEHPEFVRLMVRESLAGGEMLRATPHDSRAMAEAFEQVRESLRGRGSGSFEVSDAVVLMLGLTFSVLANRDTYVAQVGMDLDDPATIRRHVALVVDQLVALVLG